MELIEIVRVHIAKSPCYPQFGISVEYTDGRALWDTDCASNCEATTLAAAALAYPDHPVTLWDDPAHYSNRNV